MIVLLIDEVCLCERIQIACVLTVAQFNAAQSVLQGQLRVPVFWIFTSRKKPASVIRGNCILYQFVGPNIQLRCFLVIASDNFATAVKVCQGEHGLPIILFCGF